jgi:glucosamine-6-phosphate deaminase
MHVQPEVLDTAENVGRIAAERIADGIRRAADEGRSFVLGCPSGRSPLTTYEELARIVREQNLDLSHVVVALMDEYVERRDGEYHAVSAHLPHSCVGFGRREILERLNDATTAPEHRIPEDALLWPDARARPGEFDRRIAELGGFDVFLLASGASDGHVALNPAGTPASSETRVVALDDATRRDNLGTFPTFDGLDDVPRFGVTVGIATIRELSRSVIMVVTGEHKRETLARLAAASTYDPEWPATILSDCTDPLFLADRAAAAIPV